MFHTCNSVSNARMIYLSVPVDLHWLARDGSEVYESTATLQVSAEGAIVLVRTAPPAGTDVTLTNCENKRTIIARIAGVGPSPEPRIRELSLQFKVEDETFWGLESA
jgi:hypothetical protein